MNLVRIQKLDLKVSQIEKQVGTITDLLSNNSIIQNAIQENELKKKMLEDLNSEIKSQEVELDKLLLKIQYAENSLYKGSISNPKELQEIQVEIVSLKHASTLMENKLLGLMASSEQTNHELIDCSEKLTMLQNESSITKTSLAGKKAQLLGETEILSQERNVLSNSISREEYQKYQDLKQQKKGIAITSFSDGACDSCGNTLTPAIQQKAKTSNVLVQCPSCGRILYSET